jgi:hypothetical protein
MHLEATFGIGHYFSDRDGGLMVVSKELVNRRVVVLEGRSGENAV